MTTPIASRFEALSPAAQALLHRMLDQREPAANIRRAIFRLSGEQLPQQDIMAYASRYAQRSSERLAARSQADGFIRLAGKRGVTISDLLRARLIERLAELQRGKKPGDASLWKLVEAERKQREFNLRRLRMQQETQQREHLLHQKERQLRVAEQKLELTRARLMNAVGSLERKTAKGKSLSTEDIRRIRSIYGLDCDQGEEENRGSDAASTMSPPEV